MLRDASDGLVGAPPLLARPSELSQLPVNATAGSRPDVLGDVLGRALLLPAFLTRYNTQRPHRSLNRQTPLQRLADRNKTAAAYT